MTSVVTFSLPLPVVTFAVTSLSVNLSPVGNPVTFTVGSDVQPDVSTDAFTAVTPFVISSDSENDSAATSAV